MEHKSRDFRPNYVQEYPLWGDSSLSYSNEDMGEIRKKRRDREKRRKEEKHCKKG
jgi:hypothetical protein